MVFHLAKAESITCDIARSMIEVTSLKRPDLRWSMIDKAGHLHRWFDGSTPAEDYSPTVVYTLPSTLRVQDPSEFTVEGDEIRCGHYECLQCGQLVEPWFTEDSCRQFIPGLTRFSLFRIVVNCETPGAYDFRSALLQGEPIELVNPDGTVFKAIVDTFAEKWNKLQVDLIPTRS